MQSRGQGCCDTRMTLAEVKEEYADVASLPAFDLFNKSNVNKKVLHISVIC